MLDRDGLETFLAVWDERSFSKAAQRLFKSQATVSQRIQHLEQHLGARLFERSTRGVEVTPAARVLHPLAERITGLFREAEEQVSTARQPMRLGCPASLAASRLAPILSRLAAQGQPVAVSTGHSSELVVALLDGRLDAAVVLERSLPTGLAWHRWGESPIVAVSGAGDPAGTWAQLAGREVVWYAFGPGADDLLERVRAQGAQITVPKASPLSVALELIRPGGMTFVPRVAVPPRGPWQFAVWPELAPYGWRAGVVVRERPRGHVNLDRLWRVFAQTAFDEASDPASARDGGAPPP